MSKDISPPVLYPRCHGSRIQTWLIRRSLHVLHLSTWRIGVSKWSCLESGPQQLVTSTLFVVFIRDDEPTELKYQGGAECWFLKLRYDGCCYNYSCVRCPQPLEKDISWCARKQGKRLFSTFAYSGRALDCILKSTAQRMVTTIPRKPDFFCWSKAWHSFKMSKCHTSILVPSCYFMLVLFGRSWCLIYVSVIWRNQKNRWDDGPSSKAASVGIPALFTLIFVGSLSFILLSQKGICKNNTLEIFPKRSCIPGFLGAFVAPRKQTQGRLMT